MARYKVLQSVAHSLGHSFTSLMHYVGDDYAMGHLLQAARRSREPILHMDLLSGRARPSELLASPLEDLGSVWASELRRLIANHQTSLDWVAVASLTLYFDLSRQRPWSFVPSLLESPYRCVVLITDDRGREWTAEFEGWWAPESGTLDPPGTAPVR